MNKVKSRLKSVRRRELRRKIVFITFLLLMALYIISKIETLSPVRALSPSQFDVVYIEKQVEVIKEVEVDRTFDSEKQQILAYIVEVFGDNSPDIITMVRQCENSTFEQHRDNNNRNGSVDKGVLQINDIHISGKEFPVCKNAHDNWKSNIDCGKAIYDKYGLSAWSCSTVLGVKSFWE